MFITQVADGLHYNISRIADYGTQNASRLVDTPNASRLASARSLSTVLIMLLTTQDI